MRTVLLMLLFLALPLRAATDAPHDAVLPERITPLTLQQAELELQAARLRLESLLLELDDARRREAVEQERLGWVREALPAATDTTQRDLLETARARQREVLEQARSQRETLERRIEETRRAIAEHRRWNERLRDAYAQQQQAALAADLKRLEERSAREIERLERERETLRARLEALPERRARERALLTARIDSTETALFVTRSRLKLASARSAYRHLAARAAEREPGDPEALLADIERLDALRRSLSSVRDLLERKRGLVTSQRAIVERKRKAGQLARGAAGEIARLLDRDRRTLDELLDEATTLEQEIDTRRAQLAQAYRDLLNRDLTARERFPYEAGIGERLLDDLLRLPQRLAELLRAQRARLLERARQASAERTLGALALLIGALGAGLSYHYRMRGTRRRALEARTFATRMIAISLHVARGVSIPAALLVGGGGALWLIGAEPLPLRLAALFLGTWIAIRLLRDIGYWFLVSPLVPEAQREPRLHRQLGLGIWTSGLLGLLAGLGALGILGEPLAILVKRLFMLSLLPAVYLGFRLRALLLQRLGAHGTSPYWLWVVRLISLLVPLAMLGIALPGLAGYINLASLIAWYLIATILVVAVWAVGRGLLGDLADAATRRIGEGQHGRLWYEGLIRPLHLGARILLAGGALFALVRLYGLGAHSTALELARTVLTYPLFRIGDTVIDPAHLALSLAVAVGSFPAGARVRRLAFDWLFSGVADRGARNSLAVFSQYFTVLLGLLLSVNLLGIDLTSLAVFAGALGVGIGFGLQNIANNFISGLILLAERPIRAGDWVTVGQYEGEITYIGIRSATVRTWDNQEVIIPNAELVSNAFTNWTRSDPVVRTELRVGVAYDGDPHTAARIIEEAVTMQPEVLLQPAPRVLLHDFGESSVDFRVLYYVDVRQFSRIEVRSRVMFAIWDALREAGIEIPFPQRDLRIRELPPGHDTGRGATPGGSAAEARA